MQEQDQLNGQDDAKRFAEAIAIANVPTLFMVLVQLTGDLRWLEEPYRPQRARGMNDNDTADCPEPIQAEIRAAALDAILAWRAGRPDSDSRAVVGTAAQDAQLGDGRESPAEYDPIIAAELLLEERDKIEKLPVPEGFEVLIIGAGVSGLCAAINLQQAGIPFTILEKSATLGRNLAGQSLSRRWCRYPKPSLFVFVCALRLVDVFCAARRTPRLPGARRGEVQSASIIRFETEVKSPTMNEAPRLDGLR